MTPRPYTMNYRIVHTDIGHHFAKGSNTLQEDTIAFLWNKGTCASRYVQVYDNRGYESTQRAGPRTIPNLVVERAKWPQFTINFHRSNRRKQILLLSFSFIVVTLRGFTIIVACNDNPNLSLVSGQWTQSTSAFDDKRKGKCSFLGTLNKEPVFNSLGNLHPGAKVPKTQTS